MKFYFSPQFPNTPDIFLSVLTKKYQQNFTQNYSGFH